MITSITPWKRNNSNQRDIIKMDPSVDWDAFKVWGSVSLVAIVVLIGGLIWCWCWCCRCCCDSCGCCSSGNCADDCHCSCCSRVKKDHRQTTSSDSIVYSRLENVVSVRGYSVSDLFMEKHVSLLHEMPSEKKRLFADKKAKIAYTNNSLPLPRIYSIIFVSYKNEFRRVIENEAKKQNAKIFTTTEEFHVMNFTLGENNKYNYEKNEGKYRLVLKCDSDYKIYHLERVVLTTLDVL